MNRNVILGDEASRREKKRGEEEEIKEYIAKKKKKRRKKRRRVAFKDIQRTNYTTSDMGRDGDDPGSSTPPPPPRCTQRLSKSEAEEFLSRKDINKAIPFTIRFLGLSRCFIEGGGRIQ